AEVPRPLARMGFGMVEVGTVTPRPQEGNARPRLFRVTEAEGVINRMGFNNEGHDAAFARLRGLRISAALGVNIGANKDSDDFVADYVLGVQRFADLADYLTVNVSSPNTPGLRNLQADEALRRLLGEVLAAAGRRVPPSRLAPPPPRRPPPPAPAACRPPGAPARASPARSPPRPPTLRRARPLPCTSPPLSVGAAASRRAGYSPHGPMPF